MVGDREELPEKTTKEIQREAEEEIARVAHLARELDQERSTMAYKMTRERRMMSLGMVLPQRDTTQSSTHDAQQTGIDSGTGHDQSVRRWVRSSTRGAGLPHSSAKHFGLQDAHQLANPPPAKRQLRSYCSREAPLGDARCCKRSGPDTQP
jgi:hypothetical protein